MGLGDAVPPQGLLHHFLQHLQQKGTRGWHYSERLQLFQHGPTRNEPWTIESSACPQDKYGCLDKAVEKEDARNVYMVLSVTGFMVSRQCLESLVRGPEIMSCDLKSECQLYTAEECIHGREIFLMRTISKRKIEDAFVTLPFWCADMTTFIMNNQFPSTVCHLYPSPRSHHLPPFLAVLKTQTEGLSHARQVPYCWAPVFTALPAPDDFRFWMLLYASARHVVLRIPMLKFLFTQNWESGKSLPVCVSVIAIPSFVLTVLTPGHFFVPNWSLLWLWKPRD